MKSAHEVHREREVAVLDAAAGVADMVQWGGEWVHNDRETLTLRLEQLRRAVFRLRDTLGAPPLRATLGDLVMAKWKRGERG